MLEASMCSVRLSSRRPDAGPSRALLAVLGYALVVFAGAHAGQVLTVAGAVDVDALGVGGQPVQDGGGEGGVTQVFAPGRQLDVGGDGRAGGRTA